MALTAECPQCGLTNPPGAAKCAVCNTPLPLSAAPPLNAAPSSSSSGSEAQPHAFDETLPSTSGWSAPPSPSGNVAVLSGTLQPGSVLGNRYEIQQLLGEGGMGAVYKARDREVDRLVALKIIRPDLASRPEILARFKQELILARQVTHKNVIRIFDLGEADGVKYITMDFIEGQDLKNILREKGKLAPEEALRIITQICRALDAAHSEGVVHRDLKPQNIMLDSKGRVTVMDFGIARSLEMPGMTQTGALVGTPEYMSPEQAKGEEVDARSDLFTTGIIFYELLTGNTPFRADTAYATLLKRTQERARPPIELDPSIPQQISSVVMKCLETDKNQRYNSALEIVHDLGQQTVTLSVTALPAVVAPSSVAAKPSWLAVHRKWAAAALAALLLVAGGIAFKLRGPTKSNTAHAPVTVLVADFTNHTGDPIFDDTLEPMFNVALEGASFINAYSRTGARKLAQKLPNPTGKLDEQSARLVAIGQGIGAVVTGSLSRRGDGYKLSVEALDARTGNSITNSEVNAPTKDELLLAVPKLAAPIRKALGDTTPESVQLAASGPFTAASLEVVHLYNLGMEQQFAGKMEESLGSFSKAVELDPNFARAYAGMSGPSAALGRQADAEKYLKLALQHADRMTERERYHTRAFFYLVTGDSQKCVEEYSTLVNQYPADRVGQADLAVCSLQLRNIPRAIEASRKAVEIVPNGVVQRLNLSFQTSFGGDFQSGEREARVALQINPSSDLGYLNLAEAQLGQGQLSQAAESYDRLETVSTMGASMAAAGLADLAVYEGRFADAVRLLEKGAAADFEAKRLDSAADKFAKLAYAQLSRGQTAAAVAAADKTLAHSQTVQARFLAGRIYAETGEIAKAQRLATSLGSELLAEPQAYGKIIQGKCALKQGDSRQAIQSFTEAEKLLDTWIGRFELGRAYLEAQQFVEADSEFDRCIKRRGEALELFLDNVPSYGYLPPVYYYQGLVREGLKSANASESFRTYLSIRGQAGEDPLLPEIRRRLGQ